MPVKARDSEPTLRGEIEYLLEHREPDFERGEAVATAWTVAALAEELGEDAADVRTALRELIQEGRVTTRRPRSGEVLYKLTDIHHDKWQAFSGPGRHHSTQNPLTRERKIHDQPRRV